MADNEKRDFVISIPGRMKWASLLAPNKRGKITLDLLIPKNAPGAAAFLKRAKELQVKAAGSEKIGPKAMYGIMDGDTMEDTNGFPKKEEQPEYAGCFVIRPKANRPVRVIDENDQDVIDSAEIYSGRWARASIDFYFLAYKDKESGLTKKMVCCNLRMVKLGKHDEKFAGGAAEAHDDFSTATAGSVADLA